MDEADLISTSRKAPSPERRRIQSVAVGFRLVRALEAAGRPMSLTQLAAAADMPTSQAHLYLASYVHEGLVQQDPSTSRYELGPYALQLGLSALRGMNMVDLAREELERLRDRSGESVHFSVWAERGPCIFINVDGARPLPFSSRIGFVLPLLASATGRVFLAHMRAADTDALLEAESKTWREAGHALGRVDVVELVEKVRRIGYAHTDSLVNIGLAGLAAPVFDYADRICGALTITAPSGTLSASASSPAVEALLASARALSARLSGRPA